MNSSIHFFLLLQFHHNLPLPSSWLQALLSVSQLPGSYHQSLLDMETLQGLDCFTKRKVLLGQQQPCLLAMEEHQVELLVGLISSQSTNFKFWPSLLMVMDQKVLWKWKEQWKMVCEPYFLNLDLHYRFIGYQSHDEKAKQLNSLEWIDYFSLPNHNSIYSRARRA